VQHFFKDVPKLGNVAVSRHAQERMLEEHILPETFEAVLLAPPQTDRLDSLNVLWREGRGIRIVILTNPEPDCGAKLVKTVYRVKPQADAKQYK
jgi:hypothetical protein